MSELGPMSSARGEQIFLGREINQHRDYSETTAIRIDETVKKLVEEGYQRARKVFEERFGRTGAHRRSVAGTRVLDGAEVGAHRRGTREHFRSTRNPSS